MLLLLAQAGGVTVDVIFFAILAVGIVLGVIFGFVKMICKIAGWILSVYCAFVFCVPLHSSLYVITDAIAKALGPQVAEALCIAISFLILLVGIKLLAWLLGKLLSAVLEKSKTLAVVNRILGGLLGLLEAFILVFLILMICNLIHTDGIMNFFGTTKVVGGIFRSDWFQWVATLKFMKG